MNQIRLFEPSFSDSMESVFRRLLAPWNGEIEAPSLRMRIDVTETPQAYAVEADLPGVNKQDIDVRVHGNVVQIDAQIKRESRKGGNGDRLLRSERYMRAMSRAHLRWLRMSMRTRSRRTTTTGCFLWSCPRSRRKSPAGSPLAEGCARHRLVLVWIKRRCAGALDTSSGSKHFRSLPCTSESWSRSMAVRHPPGP